MDISITSNNTLLELMLHLQTFPQATSLLVGGCVRDIQLKKSPKDFDVVTNIDLDEISNVLSKNGWSIDEAGKQFFVLIASKNDQQFEIALFRKDCTYTDGRRPDSVQVGTIEEDAMRRDFTINSLYLNPWTGEIHDPTGRGLEDLKNRIIRFNGKASERIKEDFLRIFRAYRQACTLGFTIEKNTLKNMRKYFNEACQKLPPERIRTEIEKFNPRSISS
mgnify:CR=1 FL=1